MRFFGEAEGSRVLRRTPLSGAYSSHPLRFTKYSQLDNILPAQVSAVIFGGTEGKWIVKKITVQAFWLTSFY